MFRRPNAIVGLSIVALMALCAIAAPWIAPYDPNKTSIALFQLPSAKYWLGTDQLGRDVLSRVIYGARASILIGIGAAVVAALLGVPIGLAAGYLGRTVDLVVMQFINLFIALPGLVLALIIIVMTGPRSSTLSSCSGSSHGQPSRAWCVGKRLPFVSLYSSRRHGRLAAVLLGSSRGIFGPMSCGWLPYRWRRLSPRQSSLLQA